MKPLRKSKLKTFGWVSACYLLSLLSMFLIREVWLRLPGAKEVILSEKLNIQGDEVNIRIVQLYQNFSEPYWRGVEIENLTEKSEQSFQLEFEASRWTGSCDLNYFDRTGVVVIRRNNLTYATIDFGNNYYVDALGVSAALPQ